MQELREFRTFLNERTEIAELKALNLLGRRGKSHVLVHLRFCVMLVLVCFTPRCPIRLVLSCRLTV